MLKLRQWTSSSSKKDSDSSASAAAPGDVTAGSSSPTSAQSESFVAPSVLKKKKKQQQKDPDTAIDAQDPPDDISSTSPSQRSQDDASKTDAVDPDTLLEHEIDKRKIGNQRMNGAVEALWSNLSKKKPLPFEMSTAQLAAVLAQLKLEDQDLDHNPTGQSSSSSEKRSGAGPARAAAAALADGLLGSGGKDKEKPDKQMIPINALGIALTSYSELLSSTTNGPDSASSLVVLPSASTTQALITSTGLLGRAYLQIAQLQTAFASDIKSVLLTRFARSHVQLDAYAGARKRADAAKSRFESARSKAQKSKREKRELEDELRIASAAYDDAVSELEMRAETVLFTSEAEDLSALTDYLHSHLDYLHQSVECLERVKDSWAHVDDRVLNRGIRAGSLVSSLPTAEQLTQQDRPRSRATSLASDGARTVRARKTSSRPGTASSITSAVAAGAGRFGFPGSGTHKGRSQSHDLSAHNKSGKTTPAGLRDAADDRSDSAVSDDDDDDEDDQRDTALGDKARSDSNSKADRQRKSSGNASRPAFNRSLSRLGIFGNKKEEGSTSSSAKDGKESPDADRGSVKTPSVKEKAEERPPSVTRGWSDTFKAKNWRRDKDRDTGGFANIGDGGLEPLPGAHVQRLDEDEQRRRADLLSGISIGVQGSRGVHASSSPDRDEDVPPLPRRRISRRELSSDSDDNPDTTSPLKNQGRDTDGGGSAQWTTFGSRARGTLHSHGPSDYDDDGARLGHVGRGESSAHTDVFQDGHGVSSPLGHSPFPSDGMGTGGAGVGATGSEPRMLAFNPTGLSAFSAGEESISSPTQMGGTDDETKRSFGLLDPRRASVAQYLSAQDTGISIGGQTDPGSQTHEDDDAAAAAEEERAVLTSNGASSQTQRYRSGGVLSRMASGGTGGGSAGTGRNGAPPPPPVPSSSTFLKNKPPPPPIPNRAAK